jgi:hypothetical protein
MNNKINDLRLMIGEIVSENFSPTLRAKLVSIDENAGTCLMECTETYYKESVVAHNNNKVGMRYEAPIYRIWNAYFF